MRWGAPFDLSLFFLAAIWSPRFLESVAAFAALLLLSAGSGMRRSPWSARSPGLERGPLRCLPMSTSFWKVKTWGWRGPWGSFQGLTPVKWGSWRWNLDIWRWRRLLRPEEQIRCMACSGNQDPWNRFEPVIASMALLPGSFQFLFYCQFLCDVCLA